MGLFETWGFSKYVIDGRFLFSFDDHKNLRILDLFHSKEREFTIDLTSARIKKRPLKKDERYSVVKVFPLNLSSVVVVFNAYVRSTCYLGYGRIDIERSSVSIGPTIEIYDYFEEVCGLHLFPFSYPLDLKVGIIIQFNLDESDSHLHVRMGVGGSLYAQKLEVPVETKSFGYFDDSICGFIENWSKSKLKSVDLSKYSLETEQQTRHRTTNWQILNEDYLKEHTHEDVCCVGETLYTYCEYKKKLWDCVVGSEHFEVDREKHRV
ncbi:hypothetical protein M3Y94_00651800 [Aphelenchoides besseyi]|nr:hypothetical protein M3Y94_00651800 [Aphelenchoides besseyi]